MGSGAMSLQRGQAMVEFAVGAGLLSTLLLGMAAISGYQDVERRGLNASRHLAFQRSWIGERALPSRSGQDVHSAHFDRPSLRRPVGSRPWLEQADVATQTSIADAPGVAGTVTAAFTPLRVASGFLGGGFDLSARGLVQASVETRVQPQQELPQPFDQEPMHQRASMAFLSDAWNAADSIHLERRVGGLSPTAAMRRFQNGWAVLAQPLSLIEPSLRELCLGQLSVEAVPEDRLGSGQSLVSVQAC